MQIKMAKVGFRHGLHPPHLPPLYQKLLISPSSIPPLLLYYYTRLNPDHLGGHKSNLFHQIAFAKNKVALPHTAEEREQEEIVTINVIVV